jgi:hypothetical protein
MVGYSLDETCQHETKAFSSACHGAARYRAMPHSSNGADARWSTTSLSAVS